MGVVIQRVPKLGTSTGMSRYEATKLFLGSDTTCEITQSVYATGKELVGTDGSALVSIKDNRPSANLTNENQKDYGSKIAERIKRKRFFLRELCTEDLLQLCYPHYALIRNGGPFMQVVINRDLSLGTRTEILDLGILQMNVQDGWSRILNVDPKYVLQTIKSASLVGIDCLKVSIESETERSALILSGDDFTSVIMPMGEDDGVTPARISEVIAHIKKLRSEDKGRMVIGDDEEE